MDEELEIYLPENPKRLIELAMDAIGCFAEDMSDIEVDYIAVTPDGDIPSRLSLAGTVLFDEYETLSIFAKAVGHEGTLMIDVNNKNDFYSSHVKFIDAFVKFNINDIMNYLNPRCVMKIDKMPYCVDYDAPHTSEGIVTNYLSHSDLDESIKAYVTYRILDGEERGAKNYIPECITTVVNRMIKMERLLDDFFVYVPT